MVLSTTSLPNSRLGQTEKTPPRQANLTRMCHGRTEGGVVDIEDMEDIEYYDMVDKLDGEPEPEEEIVVGIYF